jgi:predicted RNase H-like HicB family nuclease
MRSHIVVRVEIFREGDVYVGLCSDLDVSSFGETIDEARKSVREAVEGFLEECEAMGTLAEVLEEAGFILKNGNWLPRQPISAELVPVG